MDEQLVKDLIKELQESKERDRDVINTLQDNIKSINKLLLGNGEVGLCERVRGIQRAIIPLWTLVSLIGIALLTGLIRSFGRM